MSEEQKTKIYSIQAEYKAQLLELQKQITALRSKQTDEINSVLTVEQKKQLDSVVAEAAKRAAERKAAAKKKAASKNSE